MSTTIDWLGRQLMRSAALDNGECWSAYDDMRLLEGLDYEEFDDGNDQGRHDLLERLTKDMPAPCHIEILDDHVVWIYNTKAGLIQMCQTDEDDQNGRAGQVTVSLWRTDHWAEFLTHHHYDYEATTSDLAPALQSTPDSLATKATTYHRLDRLDLALVRYEAWQRCCLLLESGPADI